MARFKHFFPIFLCAAITASPLLFTQSVKQIPQAPPVQPHPVPETRDLFATSPFTERGNSGPQFRIIPATAMSQADQDLLARTESALRRQARASNLGYSHGSWTHVQLACPAFPNHLLVRFTRDNGKGDLSIFSASIPRDNNDRLRLVPVLRRSFTLVSPAPANPITVATFNRLLQSEKSSNKLDVMETAECYAALAGVTPDIESADSGNLDAMRPILDLTANGQSIVRFSAPDPRPTDWELTFNRQGRLVRAKSSHGIASAAHPVPAPSMPEGYQVPPSTAPAPVRLP